MPIFAVPIDPSILLLISLHCLLIVIDVYRACFADTIIKNLLKYLLKAYLF